MKAALKKKVLALLDAREAGKLAYAEADGLLEELIGELPLDTEFDLGDGRRVTLVDNYAKGNVSWKPCGVRRFDLKVKEG